MAVSNYSPKSCVCHNPMRHFPEVSEHHSSVARAPETSVIVTTSIQCHTQNALQSPDKFWSLNPIIWLSIVIYTLCDVITCIYTSALSTITTTIKCLPSTEEGVDGLRQSILSMGGHTQGWGNSRPSRQTNEGDTSSDSISRDITHWVDGDYTQATILQKSARTERARNAIGRVIRRRHLSQSWDKWIQFAFSRHISK
jgi:hypothetical protein